MRVVAQVMLERTFQYRRIQRPTPNPNVLTELGYAAARIGWEHVILVQNTAYGDLGGLPFDLRSRRIVPFNLSAKESRRDERPRLRDQLESALRKALGEMLTPTFWQGEARSRWFWILAHRWNPNREPHSIHSGSQRNWLHFSSELDRRLSRGQCRGVCEVHRSGHSVCTNRWSGRAGAM